jgi:hypothetical protein
MKLPTLLAKREGTSQSLSAGKDGSRTRALSNRCSRLVMSRRHGEAGAAWLQQKLFVRRLPTASPSTATGLGVGITRRHRGAVLVNVARVIAPSYTICDRCMETKRGTIVKNTYTFCLTGTGGGMPRREQKRHTPPHVK